MIYKQTFASAKKHVLEHIFKYLGLGLVLVWIMPLLLTGNRLELGDFSFFTQGYEAVRTSIIDYHQFPWINPWVAGGVPLFANPQIGVFSATTLFALLFGAPLALKITIAIFMILGYLSMYTLLNSYFKIEETISTLLSIIWVLCSFFTSHLPSHFTFIWFLVAPYFIYASLTLDTRRKAILYGLLFAIMANSQVHNSFFQISLICGAILFVRLLYSKSRTNFMLLLGISLAIVIILAGPKLLLTFQNVHDFPRIIGDPPTSISKSILGILLPFSIAAYLHGAYPSAPWGWGEQTVSIGFFAISALIISAFYYVHTWRAKNLDRTYNSTSFRVVLTGIGFFMLGLGAFHKFSPYNILKQFPIFSETRVSARWFLWLIICILVFIGLQAKKSGKNSFPKFLITGVLVLSVAELFVLNFGYYSTVLNHAPNTSPKNITEYTFEQSSLFGESTKLPAGKGEIRKDLSIPKFYREYENTTYNLGTLQANDALVDLNTKSSPRCSWNKGCGLVLTGNARVKYWSPNKIVLERTSKGKIQLNMNNSSYFTINGKRNDSLRVAEPYTSFNISQDITTREIVIAASPSALNW